MHRSTTSWVSPPIRSEVSSGLFCSRPLHKALTPYRGSLDLKTPFLLRKKLEDFQKIKTSILDFYEKDLPAFELWVSSIFGKLQSQVRLLKEELKYFEFLLNKIGDLVLTENLKPHEAYLKAIRDNPLPSYRPPVSNRELDGIDTHFFKIGNGSKELPSLRMRENFSLKQLYRKLSRFLHPDLNPNLCAFRKRMWSEVQAAYQNQEQDKLELFLAFLSYGELESELSTLKGMSDLDFWLEKLHSNSKILNAHAAFSFAKIKDKQKLLILRHETRSNLREEKKYLKLMLSELKSQLNQLKRKPKSKDLPYSNQLTFEIF